MNTENGNFSVFSLACPLHVRSSTLQDCNVVRLDLVSKSLKQKLCLSIQFNILYLLCHLVTLIFDFCTSAPKVRVREYIFPPHIFCTLYQFAQTPSLFFVNIMKEKKP